MSTKYRPRVAATVALVLLLGLAGCAPGPPTPPSVTPKPDRVVRRITIKDTIRRMDAGEHVVFLDTRERAIGPMIQGAVHVPYSWLGKWAKEQLKGAFIVAYCTCLHEASAARAVLDLQRDGFTNAYALLGGLHAWAGVGRPIEIQR